MLRHTIVALFFAESIFAQPMMMHPLLQTSVFAVTGKACPAGSTVYKGLASKMAAGSNMIYCQLIQTVSVFDKKEFNGKCPFDMKEYVDPKYKPDPDVVWCDPTSSTVKPPPGLFPKGKLEHAGSPPKALPSPAPKK